MLVQEAGLSASGRPAWAVAWSSHIRIGIYVEPSTTAVARVTMPLICLADQFLASTNADNYVCQAMSPKKLGCKLIQQVPQGIGNYILPGPWWPPKKDRD
eukprot:scaffold619261_cov52-Prasinocladus_malaysianus.AAC.2